MDIHRKLTSLTRLVCLISIVTFLSKQESVVSAAPASLSERAMENRQLISYVLKAGDELEVKVYREDDLETKTKVDKGGTIALPLIGEVKVGGLTVRNARTLITSLYEKDYLVNPQVTLTYTAYVEGAGRFTVLGRVEKAGSFSTRPSTVNLPAPST